VTSADRRIGKYLPDLSDEDVNLSGKHLPLGGAAQQHKGAPGDMSRYARRLAIVFLPDRARRLV